MTALVGRSGLASPPLLDAAYDPDEGPEALLRGLLSDGRTDRDESVRMIRSGKRLARLRDMDKGSLRRAYGVRSVKELVEKAHGAGELGYGWIQARRYLRLASLTIEPFFGIPLSLRTLLRIASLQAEGAEVEALVQRCQAGEALPAPARAKGTRALARPSRQAERADVALRHAAERLSRLYERTEGWDLRHAWARGVDDRLRGLVMAYAERRGLPLHELWPERRDADRVTAGAPDHAGSGAGERRDDAGLGSLPAAPTPEASAAGEFTDDPSGSISAAPAPAAPAAAEAAAPAARTGAEGTAAPLAVEAAAPEEPWYVPVVRGVLAQLREEEAGQLSGHLVMAMAGRSPAELLTFLRQVGRRLDDEALRDDLGCWIAGAALGDLAERWPYLYNFFTTAQLPGFRLSLHSLRAVALPEEPRALLESACVYWRLAAEEDEDGGAADGPAGTRRLPAELRLAARRISALLTAGADASVEPLSWLWTEAYDLQQELAALAREVDKAGA